MNFNIVWAVVVRHLYNFKHSLDRLTDAFYWPAMDIFIWGFTALYITKQANQLPQIIIMLLSGVVLWLVVWRAQYEITVNLLEEMWSRNLVNMFSSPLRVREWVLAVFILGLIKMIFSVGFSILLALVLYKTNIFSLGFYLIPFIMSLTITGWAVGLFVSGLIIRYGMRIQTFAWGGIALLSPFSGVYYPVSTLPLWAQKVAMYVPTSYIFEGMRSVIFKGSMLYGDLVKSFIINAIYMTVGLLFFNLMFKKSKIRGLADLE